MLLFHFFALGIITLAQAQKYLATISDFTKELSLDSSKKELSAIALTSIL
jgi:hypothetical protein